MAYGGQGAPLVPAFHLAVLGHPTEKRIVLKYWWYCQYFAAITWRCSERI